VLVAERDESILELNLFKFKSIIIFSKGGYSKRFWL